MNMSVVAVLEAELKIVREVFMLLLGNKEGKGVAADKDEVADSIKGMVLFDKLCVVFGLTTFSFFNSFELSDLIELRSSLDFLRLSHFCSSL